MNNIDSNNPGAPDHPQRVAVIGGGSKKGQDFIRALAQRSDVALVATVFNHTIPSEVAPICGRIIMEGDIETLVKEVEFDVAVVSLPHFQHRRVTEILLKAGKRVVKEKPLSLDVETAEHYDHLISSQGGAPIFTTVQRSVHPAFLKARPYLEDIGEVKSFEYRYTFALKEMTSGWRAEREKSGGGVVMDMGYHIIDVVNFFFGPPSKVESKFAYAFEEMRQQKLEDYALLSFIYPTFSGEIVLDRHAKKKVEEFKIVGSKGEMVITPEGYRIVIEGEVVDFAFSNDKLQLIAAMFDQCFNVPEHRGVLDQAFRRNLENVRIIEGIYLGNKD